MGSPRGGVPLILLIMGTGVYVVGWAGGVARTTLGQAQEPRLPTQGPHLLRPTEGRRDGEVLCFISHFVILRLERGLRLLAYTQSFPKRIIC